MNVLPHPRLVVSFATALVLCAVGSLVAAEHPMHSGGSAVPTAAIAVLVPGSNSHVSGTVNFTQEDGGVHVVADISGLTPGKHGFHIHEKGDLSKPDLSSAGGHFNPEGRHHADRTAPERHAGDLGNLEADANGHATVDFVDAALQLSGPHSIIGRAVIVHAKADDLKSQPAGDAGSRVGGGVIGITSTAAK